MVVCDRILSTSLWEFCHFAHLPCHLCPIFTCPSRTGLTEDQTNSTSTKRRVKPPWPGHPVCIYSPWPYFSTLTYIIILGSSRDANTRTIATSRLQTSVFITPVFVLIQSSLEPFAQRNSPRSRRPFNIKSRIALAAPPPSPFSHRNGERNGCWFAFVSASARRIQWWGKLLVNFYPRVTLFTP